jgi:hypothetical protein
MMPREPKFKEKVKRVNLMNNRGEVIYTVRVWMEPQVDPDNVFEVMQNLWEEDRNFDEEQARNRAVEEVGNIEGVSAVEWTDATDGEVIYYDW